MAKQPNSLEEYNARHAQNYNVEGFGIDGITVSSPCPFCAGADWCKFNLLDMEEEASKPHTCSDCGRTAKLVFNRPDPSTTTMEIVQTDGEDPPEWLTKVFPIRREN
jgi:hypothetical protein